MTFPGLYRPGLIEATGAEVRRLRALVGFRGFTAPASLKHVAQDIRDHSFVPFPGLYRPGLIEATIKGGAAWQGLAVSGALPPRPH